MDKKEANSWLRKIYRQLNSYAAPEVRLNRRLKTNGYKPHVSGLFSFDGEATITINPKIRKRGYLSTRRKPSPFITTIIHECLHTAGVMNENEVNHLTKELFHTWTDRQLLNLLRKFFGVI